MKIIDFERKGNVIRFIRFYLYKIIYNNIKKYKIF